MIDVNNSSPFISQPPHLSTISSYVCIIYNLKSVSMKFPLLVLGLFCTCLAVYDTTLVGNTTYLQLRIGEFKKLSLPFNFTTYYSIDTGKAEATARSNITQDVCTVEERQFDLQETDYLSVGTKNMVAKDVATQYETLLQKRFLIDMLMTGNLLFVALTDAIKVIQLESSNKVIGNIVKTFELAESLNTGKLIKASNTTLYFVGPISIYRITKDEVTKLDGYATAPGFQSAAIVDQKIILIAAGQKGVHVYKILEDNKVEHTKTLDSTFFTISDISDIQANETFVYLLDRQGNIFNLSVNSSTAKVSKQNSYKIDRTGCQNMELFEGNVYITCPELHRLSFSDGHVTDKSFENPNFNPRSIVFFNSIILLVGHNLAKIYNEGIQMGYYHDFIMRKLVPLHDKLLIGSDYGLSLTTWDVTEPQITCGLKRKGTTEKYEGKVSTTINVVAECNQQYFKQHNISYKEELKNDACLYHFPISINFWVGTQINYFPFKIGVGVVILLSMAGLLGWFILDKKVTNLTSAIKHYSALAQTTNTGGYAHMVQQHLESEGRDSSKDKEMHEIGD